MDTLSRFLRAREAIKIADDGLVSFQIQLIEWITFRHRAEADGQFTAAYYRQLKPDFGGIFSALDWELAAEVEAEMHPRAVFRAMTSRQPPLDPEVSHPATNESMHHLALLGTFARERLWPCGSSP